MARDLFLCVLFSFQILQCLSQEQDPSVEEYFLEAVNWMNRTQWRYFLPEETDIDQDGNLSDLEVQHKFNTYMGEVFKLMDQDEDNSITEEELRSLKLDIPQFTKVVDITLENFPLRPFFLAADANGDGIYDEHDFYTPERNTPEVPSHQDKTTVQISPYSHKVTLAHGTVGVARIGQNEGAVICKSLGYQGLEQVVEPDVDDYYYNVYSYICDGTEAVLEHCQKVPLRSPSDFDHVKWSVNNHSTDQYAAPPAPMGYAFAPPPAPAPPAPAPMGLDEAPADDRGDARRKRGLNTRGLNPPPESEERMGVVCQGEDAVRLVGGKDSASGDVYVGIKGLTHLYKRNNSEVICRELGYSGVIRMTKDSAFTGRYLRENDALEDKFHCNGDEQRLADCPKKNYITFNQKSGNILSGIICATDGRTGVDQGLSELVDWEHNARIWEKGGRFLFIADANGDGKLTLEELATKSKHLMWKILAFLDVSRDGKISVDDINLHLSVGPIKNLVSELFDDVTAGKWEFDLYNIEIAGQDMDKFWSHGGLKDMDYNEDLKVNSADIYNFFNRNKGTKATFLLPMLSEKLDKNQDGKIQWQELGQFIDEMFNQFDMDKDGVLTLKDVYSLLRENGFDCLQVGALRSYIKIFLGTIKTLTRNFFGYIFHQLDMDGNGQISPAELEQMHVPCDIHDRYRYRDYVHYDDYDPGKVSDPNDRKGCRDMFETFFGSKIRGLIRSFPDLDIGSESHSQGSHGTKKTRGRDGLSRPTSFYAHPFMNIISTTFADKMTDRACEMLT